MREEQKSERKKYPFATVFTNLILIIVAIFTISFFVEGVARNVPPVASHASPP